MWELDCEESWAPKNWCFWTVALEKTHESPLDCKEIQPVNSKGNQSWIFIGRTNAETEAPILWPPDAKNWLIVKDLDAGTGWKREEKGMTEDEMVGWHHQLNGHEFEQAPGDGEGWCAADHRVAKNWTQLSNWHPTPVLVPGKSHRQRSLVGCSPWGRRESDTTERLNNNLLIYFLTYLFYLFAY